MTSDADSSPLLTPAPPGDASSSDDATLRRLISATPAIFFAARAADWVTTFISDNVQEILGHTPERFLEGSQFWLDHIHPEDRDATLRRSELLSAGAPAVREYRFRHADGSFRWMHDEIRLLPGTTDGQDVIAGCWLDITEQKRTEEEQQARQEIFSAIATQASEAIVLVDSVDGRFIEFNEAAHRDLGYRRDEFETMRLDDIQAEHSPGEIRRNLETIQQRGHVSFETLHRHRDGSIRNVKVSAGRLELRQSAFVAAVWTDITDRVQAEAALRESEERYRLIADNTQDLIWVADLASGCFTYVSPSYARVRGFSSAELVGRPVAELQAPGEREATWQKLVQRIAAFESGDETARHGTYRLGALCKDGRVLPCEVVTTLMTDASGRATQILGVTRDLTERQRAEDALRASEERYRLIADHTADTIWVYDLDADRFTYVSPSSLDLSGFPPEAIVGRSMSSVLTPSSLAVVAQLLPQALAAIARGDDSARTQKLELEQRARDGRVTPVEIVANILCDQQGRPHQLLGISRDIAQRKRAEAELAAERASLAARVEERTADLSRTNAELARAVRAKDEFLANMSHELRTPLNAILALSESLLDQIRGPVNERQRASLSSIEASGRHLLTLINDILDLSKIEAGRLDLELEPTPLAELCEASLLFVREMALKKQLQIGFSLDDQLTVIEADPQRLKQMLVNLLSNAVKFTEPGGTVELAVAVDREAEAVRFAVADSGVGIAPEMMARLFQPFTQLDASLSRRHEGTGLGLALVRRLAELHGGSVAVESQVGHGSRFVLSLPHRPAVSAPSRAIAALAAEEAPAPPVAGPRRTALVIEDSESAAEQLARYLGELGIDATILARGDEAVSRAIALRPDLVFLDLLLPGKTGWEVLQELQSEPATRTIPVVVVSVVNEHSSLLASGARTILPKPVTRGSLRRALAIVDSGPATATSEPVPAIAAVVPQAAARKARVLLAEDNEINIQAIGDYLQEKGYHVIVARNGREAVELARLVRPDLVLMDVQMPEVDGLEATRRLRADRDLASLPIVALTALAMPGDRERCLAAGMNEYITKPVSLKGLVDVIERLRSV